MKSTYVALRKIGLIFLCASTICVYTLAVEVQPLYTSLTRLHVVANSDTAFDQELKLKVRDAVVEEVARMTCNTKDSDEAYNLLKDNLPHIERVAQEIVFSEGFDYTVTGTICQSYPFPRRTYDTFTLPAGNYRTLRIEIGEARGQNWWCVVFPPLCTSASIKSKEISSALTENQIRIITDEGITYELRFWLLDFLAGI